MKVLILLAAVILQESLALTGPYDGVFDFQDYCCYNSSTCEFDERLYQNGELLQNSCSLLRCIGNDNWKFEGISPKCRAAMFWGTENSLIRTFDYYQYNNWNGTCNYTAAQPVQSWPATYNPESAVYVAYVPCPSIYKICLGFTTYKVSRNTVITVNHRPFTYWDVQFAINNQYFPISSNPKAVPGHRVIAWGGTYWAYFQGPDFAVSVAPSMMTIYSLFSCNGDIAGLSGLLNNYYSDDATLRNGTAAILYPFSLDFPKSWKTLQQSNCNCTAAPANATRVVSLRTIAYNRKTCENEDEYKVLCTKAYEGVDKTTFDHLFAECMKNMCSSPQVEEDFDEISPNNMELQ